MGSVSSGARALLRPERMALVLVYGCTLSALVGYATFGLHPEMLLRYPDASGFYAVAFGLFAQLQVWVAFLAIALYLILGWLIALPITVTRRERCNPRRKWSRSDPSSGSAPGSHSARSSSNSVLVSSSRRDPRATARSGS